VPFTAKMLVFAIDLATNILHFNLGASLLILLTLIDYTFGHHFNRVKGINWEAPRLNASQYIHDHNFLAFHLLLIVICMIGNRS